GSNLDGEPPRFIHGADLREDSLHVPLVLAGGGVAPAVSDGLFALQDVPALLLDGELPQRERLFLQTASGGGAPPLYRLRTSPAKVGLRGASDGAAAVDRAADRGELKPLPADDASVRAIEAWRHTLPR